MGEAIRLSLTILISLFLIKGCQSKESRKLADPNSPSMNGIIENLEASGYDKYVRPHWITKENVTEISVFLILNSITSVDEINMDLDVDMFVMRQWDDVRLINVSKEEKVAVFGALENRLWIPNFYFVNSKKARYHNVTTLNQETYIDTRIGRVNMNVRVTVKVSCPMELWNFPMDNQTCELIMQSDIHDLEVVYKWADDPVSVNADVALPKFNLLQKPVPNTCVGKIGDDAAEPKGMTYSCLKLDIHIVRQFGYYLIQIYIPSVCLVMMSWVSFWLTVESTPARASVGAITVLTITTMSGAASAMSPKVSYLKALDIWFLTIIGFVFSAFFEFAIANTVYRTTRNRKIKSFQKRRKRLQELRQSANVNCTVRNNIYCQVDDNSPDATTAMGNMDTAGNVDPYLSQSNQETTALVQAPATDATPAQQNRANDSSAVDWDEHHDDSTGCYCCTKSADTIDSMSRWLFPAAFVIFNGIYWRVYGAYMAFGDWDNINEVAGNNTETEYGIFFD